MKKICLDRIKWKYINGVWKYTLDGKVLGVAKTKEEKRVIEERTDFKIRMILANED